MSSNDPAARRLLPQSAHVDSFSFVPPSYQPPRETQKSSLSEMAPKKTVFGCSDMMAADYVFVDEHNRHKRLKGMDGPPLVVAIFDQYS
jgi:hypothetical protein